MELATWLPLYKRICADFGFDRERDLESAIMLSKLVGGGGAQTVRRLKAGFPKSAIICGGSDNLADDISSMKVEGFVVAADSATTVLIEAGVHPDMIVTDLDGIVEDQIEENKKGATVFVHAHGDNIESVKRFYPKFSDPVVGTCQCPPPQGLFNFGGFTDGDRAACICADMGCREMTLAGFDFENPSEKSGKDREVKKRKLRWAKEILQLLRSQGVVLEYAGEGKR